MFFWIRPHDDLRFSQLLQPARRLHVGCFLLDGLFLLFHTRLANVYTGRVKLIFTVGDISIMAAS